MKKLWGAQYQYNILKDRLETLEYFKKEDIELFKKFKVKEYEYLINYKKTLEDYLDAEKRKKTRKRKTFSELQRLNIIDDLLNEQKNKCFYCKIDLVNGYYYNQDSYKFVATIDHFIPFSKGGKDDITNFVASCKVCNHFKSNITPKISIEKAKEIFKKGNSTMNNFIDF